MNVFISYASEDRDDFVQPLVDALEQKHTVWFAPYELTLGDSLLKKISDGLRLCDFGVVILSPAFFAKKWPQNELDGLSALETTKKKLILPVWKDVTEEDVKVFSPILAGRFAARAAEGVDYVVSMINQAVDAAARTAAFSPMDAIKGRLKRVATDIKVENESRKLLGTEEGVNLVYGSITDCFNDLEAHVTTFASETGLRFKVTRSSPMRCCENLTIDAPFFLFGHLSYYSATNSAEAATLKLHLGYEKSDGWSRDEAKPVMLYEEQFVPFVDSSRMVCWKCEDKRLTNAQLSVYALELLVAEIEKAKALSD
jgi:hypothetical protein